MFEDLLQSCQALAASKQRRFRFKHPLRSLDATVIEYLLLKSTWAWSLSNLAAMLRFNLLSYRDLWAWLDAPFEIPITVPEGVQLTLLT